MMTTVLLSPVEPTVFSRSLKSTHFRDIVLKQYSADIFNKRQKRMTN